MKKKVEIYRLFSDDNQASGLCVITDENGFPLFTALSLERGNRGNEPMISNILAGVYVMRYEYSNRFNKKLWEIKGVTNRSECKFHSANYWFQLNGCIALGNTYTDINKDGYRDVTNSVNTMKVFEEMLNGQVEVELIIY